MGAYNLVCNVNGTNTFGASVIYYYPCTNNITPG
jgi:hypothetical protein